MAGNKDNRAIFDPYLYDYLKKANLHATAEIYRNEANMAAIQTSPPGVDVTQGFIYEWFPIFYDVRARPSVTVQRNEGSSSRAIQIHIVHQCDCVLNSQMIHELTVGSNVDIVIDGNVVPAGSPSTKIDPHSENYGDAEELAMLATIFPEIYGNDTDDDLARDEGSSGTQKNDCADACGRIGPKLASNSFTKGDVVKRKRSKRMRSG